MNILASDPILALWLFWAQQYEKISALLVTNIQLIFFPFLNFCRPRSGIVKRLN